MPGLDDVSGVDHHIRVDVSGVDPVAGEVLRQEAAGLHRHPPDRGQLHPDRSLHSTTVSARLKTGIYV